MNFPVKLFNLKIDDRLDFSICKITSRVSYIIWNLKDVVNQEYLTAAYLAFIQSHISYEMFCGFSEAVNDILLIKNFCIFFCNYMQVGKGSLPTSFYKSENYDSNCTYGILILTKVQLAEFNT